MQLQQGDVVFERVQTMPSKGTVVKPSRRGYVLAEGEATGHAHVLDPTGVLELRAVDGVLYARIAAPADVRHDEHQALTLPPGVWKVDRVREYDHFLEEARQVVD